MTASNLIPSGTLSLNRPSNGYRNLQVPRECRNPLRKRLCKSYFRPYSEPKRLSPEAPTSSYNNFRRTSLLDFQPPFARNAILTRLMEVG